MAILKPPSEYTLLTFKELCLLKCLNDECAVSSPVLPTNGNFKTIFCIKLLPQLEDLCLLGDLNNEHAAFPSVTVELCQLNELCLFGDMNNENAKSSPMSLNSDHFNTIF